MSYDNLPGIYPDLVSKSSADCLLDSLTSSSDVKPAEKTSATIRCATTAVQQMGIVPKTHILSSVEKSHGPVQRREDNDLFGSRSV